MNPNSHQVHILYSVHFVQRYALETLIAMVIIYRVLIGDKNNTPIHICLLPIAYDLNCIVKSHRKCLIVI